MMQPSTCPQSSHRPRTRVALTLSLTVAGLLGCDVDLRDVYASGADDAFSYSYDASSDPYACLGGFGCPSDQTPDAEPGGGGFGDNSCRYAFDGACDEPNLCSTGTDSADCRGVPTADAGVPPPDGELCYLACARVIACGNEGITTEDQCAPICGALTNDQLACIAEAADCDFGRCVP
jgi:hypothetical protein